MKLSQNGAVWMAELLFEDCNLVKKFANASNEIRVHLFIALELIRPFRSFKKIAEAMRTICQLVAMIGGCDISNNQNMMENLPHLPYFRCALIIPMWMMHAYRVVLWFYHAMFSNVSSFWIEHTIVLVFDWAYYHSYVALSSSHRLARRFPHFYAVLFCGFAESATFINIMLNLVTLFQSECKFCGL